MLIHLDRIREEPFEWQESLDFDPSSFDRAELISMSTVRWDGTIHFVDPGFYLKGKLSYEQRLACDRCLKETEEAVTSPLELLILTYPEKPAAEEQELQEKDMSVIHLDGEELDTAQIFMEQLQLNIPMKPLCRPDCAGLCPHCGADRNEETCGCAEQAADPRWAPLQALRGKIADR
ncbi:MAG: DUF177 domain-containing protein [Acidobacteria bacterium]|nr:DUF177 domain-containing protein [Acidobacteriota bacterium]